jgi:PAS domain S-box-containing protein
MTMQARTANLVSVTIQRLRQWWLDRSVRTKGLIVVSVPLIILVAVSVASLAVQLTEHQERRAALAASAVSSTSSKVLADAVNAETGVRGYAATRDPVFLQPYSRTLTRIGAERRALRTAAIAEGDTRQQGVVNATAGQALAELAQLRSALGAGAPLRTLQPALLRQKVTMDRLRAQVGRLARRPLALVIPRRQQITGLATATEVLDIAAVVLGLLGGLVGVALFTSGISRRVTAAAANADRLGEGRPLEPVSRSADDIGHLADAIVRAGGLIAGRAAERDRPQLALLGALVHSSDDAIVSSSIDGLITSWNPSAERIYGYPAAEAVGQPAALVVEAGQDGAETKFAAAFIASESSNGSNHSAASDGSLHHETVQRRKDGTTFPASVMLSAIRDDDGALIGTSSIARDITEQLRSGAELHSRMDDLERANQNLETFTFSVSHDLRAPLRSLGGFSAALLEDCGDDLGEDGRDYAQRIRAASERMSALIEDLLHLSRLWRTDIQDVQPVNLSAEVARIADELQLGAPDRHVRLTIEDGVCAPADRTLIRTVLENLVGNAWKFTSRQADAAIDFGTTPVKDAPVCCYVRDNGAGFDQAHADKLFAPFERLHGAAEFPGTGVGLASVRQIVERHGGHVWAQGAVGQGATFYFTLDAKETK